MPSLVPRLHSTSRAHLCHSVHKIKLLISTREKIALEDLLLLQKVFYPEVSYVNVPSLMQDIPMCY